MIGKLQRVALREVWKHEAYDFTRWLEENVDVLNDVIDLELAGAERERTVGEFSVDLVAEDDGGNAVVIENQLERSDHPHLGQLLTYTAALDAVAAIWIVAQPRAEHVKAIQWLNEQSGVQFYLVQVEAVQIGESAPAPLLTKIVGPSVEARAAGQAKQELSERQKTRRRFWSLLLERAKERTRLHSGLSPAPQSWITAGAGISGLGWVYSVVRNDARVELYIDRGDEEENLAIFEALAREREDVEAKFQGPLEWQRLDGRKACRIRHVLHVEGWEDQKNWETIADAMIDAMIRFEKALRPHVRQIQVG